MEEEEGWGAKAAPICALAPSAEPLSIKGAGSTLARRQERAKAPRTQQGPPTQGCCGAKGACLGVARRCPSSPGACTQLHTQAHTCAHTWPALLLPALTDTDIPVQAPSRCMHTHARSCTSTQLVRAHTRTLPCKRTASACTHMCTCTSLQGQSWCAHARSCASMQLVRAHARTHSCVSTQASTCIHMHTPPLHVQTHSWCVCTRPPCKHTASACTHSCTCTP